MTENIDTYVLPEESDKYLADVLPASNPLRLTWEVLTVTQQETYLSAALQYLENLNYIGDKAYYFQPLKFPRIARGIPTEFNKTPLELKRAQAAWAADIMRQELYVMRRNTELCAALGFISNPNTAQEQPKQPKMPKEVEVLLHRWITSWRRL